MRVFISLGVVDRLKLHSWSHESLCSYVSLLEGYCTGRAEGEEMLLEMALKGTEACKAMISNQPHFSRQIFACQEKKSPPQFLRSMLARQGGGQLLPRAMRTSYYYTGCVC